MTSKLETAKRNLVAAEARAAEAADAIEAATEDIAEEELEALNAEFDSASEDVTRSRVLVERQERIAEARKTNPVLATPPITVTRNEPTYRPDGGASFFADMTINRMNSDSQERLARNSAELAEKRATSGDSADVVGAIFPAYLAGLLVEVAREGRPFANVLQKMPLPAVGENFSWPRVTTGTDPDVQIAELDEPSNTVFAVDNDDSDLVTIAGMADISRQSLERSFPGIDVLIANDLVRAYNARLDRQLISGTGANGQHLGVRAVSSPNTVDFASGDQAALLVKMYDAVQKVATNRFMPATAIVMHPRRAAWLAAGKDTDTPIFQQGGLYLSSGQQDMGFVGSMAGLPVLVDSNVPANLGGTTNQDEIYVVRLEDMFLMEGALRQVTYEEVLSGTFAIRIMAYAYSVAAIQRYPKGITIISGNGLQTPSF